MSDRLAFHPDLNECLLEERLLLAYSPSIPGTIFTTGGYIILTTPPGLSSNLSTMSSNSPGSGGSPGGNGGNMPTSFNISGFGPSSFTIGNVTGYPALAGGAGSSRGGSGSISIGSGANDSTGGGGGSGTFSNFSGYSSSFSSGYNFGLSSANSFGMQTNPLGSVPVHSYGNLSSVQDAMSQVGNVDQTQAQATTDANAPLLGPTSASGMSQSPSLGPAGTLLRKPGMNNPLLMGPGMNNSR
jgi:hypothetical protein